MTAEGSLVMFSQAAQVGPADSVGGVELPAPLPCRRVPATPPDHFPPSRSASALVPLCWLRELGCCHEEERWPAPVLGEVWLPGEGGGGGPGLIESGQR